MLQICFKCALARQHYRPNYHHAIILKGFATVAKNSANSHPDCFRPFLAKHHPPLSTRNSLLEPGKRPSNLFHNWKFKRVHVNCWPIKIKINNCQPPWLVTGCRIHSLHNRSSLAHSPHHSTSTGSEESGSEYSSSEAFCLRIDIENILLRLRIDIEKILLRLRVFKTHLLLDLVPHPLVRRLRLVQAIRAVPVLLQSVRQRTLQVLLNAPCSFAHCQSGSTVRKRKNWRQLQWKEIDFSFKKCVAWTDVSNQNEKECKMEGFSDTDDFYNGDWSQNDKWNGRPSPDSFLISVMWCHVMSVGFKWWWRWSVMSVGFDRLFHNRPLWNDGDVNVKTNLCSREQRRRPSQWFFWIYRCFFWIFLWFFGKPV